MSADDHGWALSAAALLTLGGIVALNVTAVDPPARHVVEAPKPQVGVTAPTVDLELGTITVEAVPPKAPVDVIKDPTPPPVPEPAPQAATAAQRDAQPAPRAPRPSEAELAASYAAQFGCGSSAVIPGGTGGLRGTVNVQTLAIHYTPGDAQLRYVIAHECMHVRQIVTYGGWGAAWDALAPAGGAEVNADCMSQAVGGGSGGITSDCSGVRGEAARAVLNGTPWQG